MGVEFRTIRELYEITLDGSQIEKDSLDIVELEGWVRTNRCNGKLGFIELNDGTYFRNAQIVYSSESECFKTLEKVGTAYALKITG